MGKLTQTIKEEMMGELLTGRTRLICFGPRM
jgi:hypothetical protein